METIFCNNGTVQLTFFFTIRLKILIAISSTLIIAILVLLFYIIKTLKWTKDTCSKRR